MQEYMCNRGYQTLINVAVLSGIGDGLYNIVFVIYAGSLSFSTLAVSLASMATLVPSLLSMLTGYFADQSRHKVRAILVTRNLQFVLFLILAFLITLPRNIWLFFLLLSINIVSDTLGTYGNGLALPLLRHLLPENKLKQSMGFMVAMTLMAQVVFQGIGSVIIVMLHHNYMVVGLINALTFLLSSLLVKYRFGVLCVAEPQMVERKQVSMIRSLGLTLRYLYRNNFLFSVIILTFFINVFGASMSGLINVTLLSVKTMWLVNYGISVAIMNMMISIGMITGSLVTNGIVRKLPLMYLFAISLSFSGLCGISFIWHESAYLSIVLLFVMGYFIGKINPRISAIVLQSIPEKRLAAVDGLLNMVSMLGAPAGQLLFLGIANVVGIAYSWFAFSIGCFFLIVIIVLKFIKMDEPMF
ncbi:MFS transporter [Lactiplantibacillus plantarum]|uniref:MFS transporter n=1 Tax=Lactiplantibacillus plantarum TaxID=1590 RepID=UPI003BA363F7